MSTHEVCVYVWVGGCADVNVWCSAFESLAPLRSLQLRLLDEGII